MSDALGLGGWLLALASLGLAAFLRARLARHTEAVARVSHELRGPLTAAQLGLELGLRGRRLPPGRLRGIELELGRASLALEDLSASAGRGPRPSGRVGPVDVTELAADSIEAWRATAMAYGVTLRLDLPPSRVFVGGDRLRLAQALGNLIANAIEHGGGEVHVRVRQQDRMIRIEVRDQGPGLPASINELRSRRGRFGRASDPRRGYGLDISCEVAAAHGGRVAAVPSQIGAGIVLELPCQEVGLLTLARCL